MSAGPSKRKAEDEVETIDLSDSDTEEKTSTAETPAAKKANLTPEKGEKEDQDVVCLGLEDEGGEELKKEEQNSVGNNKDRLIKEFVLITKTDSDVATYFLGQHDWKLDQAVNDFFNLSGEILSEDTSMAKSLQNEKWAKNVATTSEVKGAFSFITWNVDGLDQRNLSPRTANVIKIITDESPDIAFLQEVVPETLVVLERNLPKYKFVIQDYERGMAEAYFVCTLLKKDSVKVLSQKNMPFENSVMMRALLTVEVEVAGIKMWLLNSHMESTGAYKEARVNQLKTAFNLLNEKSRTHHVLFAGDLNLRDAELPLAGGIPSGAFDLWEACDKRDTCKFTWDSARNTNIQLQDFGSARDNPQRRQFKPRLRFDRAYLCPCKKDNSDRPFAKHFGLVGIGKVPGMQCYTSDHWGLQAYFTVNKS